MIKIKSQSYFLRKIVGGEYGGYIGKYYYPDTWFEIFECGHKQRPVTDCHGETNAYRCRCRQCPKEV